MQQEKRQLLAILNKVNELIKLNNDLNDKILIQNRAIDLLLVNTTCDNSFCNMKTCLISMKDKEGKTCREVKKTSIMEKAEREINLLKEINKKD